MLDEETYKVVLIGESGVGKTSIINYFIYEVYDESVNSSTSVGFVSKEMKFNGRNIKFDIWDTAGQERFRSLAKIFYKNANVIILVYDMTNRNSFEEIKNYWYKEIHENCHDINKFNFN